MRLVRAPFIALLAAVAVLVSAWQALPADPKEPGRECDDDAMIVFDASGSMSGVDRLGISTMTTRIEKVRTALGQVLPEVSPSRRIGLISYGPGPYNNCENISLDVEPAYNTGERIMESVKRLNPAGPTPLTASVAEAVRVLRYEEKPAVVVLVTDGEETCKGDPCALADTLKSKGKQTTVHVIGYRVRDYSWTGAQAYQSKCLPEKTGGLYISVETTDELIAAFRKTLGCPLLTRRAIPRTMAQLRRELG